ncbi:MAG: hypothetical protein ACI84E_000930 [Planctomycetota bacterium]|jgi:hypothetical protein
MNPLRLPFDQYQRYRVVADIVERLRPLVGEKRKLRILDVGGRTANLRAFLPKDDVVLVDMEASEAKGLVLGDGCSLPFATESFDVVCAFDTLEHVPVDRRESFTAECWRVTKSWVLLAGPYDSMRVRKSEKLLNRFLRKKLKVEHRYLKEHLNYGLPNRADLEQWFEQQGGQAISLGHGNLDRWFALMCLELYIDDDPALRPMAGALFEFYNKSLYASDHADPVYRHVVIGAYGGSPLPNLEGLLEPPVAPAGTLAPFTELLQQLTVFDRERANWRKERAAFTKSVHELGEDLAGHRAVLNAQVQELARRAQVSEVLQADLAGHKTTLERELTARVEVERVSDERALERGKERAALADAMASSAALQQDIDGHKQTLENLERERSSLAQANSVLEADLKGHRDSLVSTQSELGDERQCSAALTLDLAGHKATLATLEKERDSLLEVVASLEADLVGHKHSLELMRGELAAEQQGSAALAQDLDGHRQSLAAVVQERDGLATSTASLASDLLGHKGSLKTLHGDLDSERRGSGALREDLAGHRKVLSETEQKCASQEQVISTLEADLKGHKQALLGTEERLGEVQDTNRTLALEAEDGKAAAKELKEVRAELANHKTELARWKGSAAELSEKFQAGKLQLADVLEREKRLGLELEERNHELQVEVERVAAAEAERTQAVASQAGLERDVAALESELELGLMQYRELLQSGGAQMAALRAETRRLEEARQKQNGQDR